MADISSITLPDESSFNFKDIEARKHIIYYGTCATTSATQAKTVTIDGITSYYIGLCVRIQFTYTASSTGPTLNINNLGAVSISRVNGTNIGQYEWAAGEVLDLVYDGTSFVIVDGGLATTSQYGVTKLSSSTTSQVLSLAATPSAINDLAQNIVTGLPVYNTWTPYAVGDRVRYGSYMYECNTAITTAELWNANHWTAIPPLQTQIDAFKNVATLEYEIVS